MAGISCRSSCSWGSTISTIVSAVGSGIVIRSSGCCWIDLCLLTRLVPVKLYGRRRKRREILSIYNNKRNEREGGEMEERERKVNMYNFVSEAVISGSSHHLKSHTTKVGMEFSEWAEKCTISFTKMCR